MIRTVGLARAEVKIDLINIGYNMFRFITLKKMQAGTENGEILRPFGIKRP